MVVPLLNRYTRSVAFLENRVTFKKMPATFFSRDPPMNRSAPRHLTLPAPHHARIRNLIREISRVPGFENVRFIILYGSASNESGLPDSDIDLCLYYEGDSSGASRFRHTILSLPGSDRFDIQLFSQLPLYIRKEVLKGRVVFAPDIRFVYDTAISTIHDYNDFKHRLDDYTGMAVIS